MIIQKVIFTKEECEEIINLSKIDYTDWDLKDRRYQSYSIDYSENTKWLFDKLKLFFETETGLIIKNLKKRLHYHVFLNGSWFDIHNDVRENRQYGVGVMLNDDFTGGDFKFYDNGEITLNKITGNSYIFDVNINHQITQITEGTRYSILWFLHRENMLTNFSSIL